MAAGLFSHQQGLLGWLLAPPINRYASVNAPTSTKHGPQGRWTLTTRSATARTIGESTQKGKLK